MCLKNWEICRLFYFILFYFILWPCRRTFNIECHCSHAAARRNKSMRQRLLLHLPKTTFFQVSPLHYEFPIDSNSFPWWSSSASFVNPFTFPSRFPDLAWLELLQSAAGIGAVPLDRVMQHGTNWSLLVCFYTLWVWSSLRWLQFSSWPLSLCTPNFSRNESRGIRGLIYCGAGCSKKRKDLFCTLCDSS